MTSDNVRPRVVGSESVEEVLDAELPIIDTHHHLWARSNQAPYLNEEFMADVNTGHNIVATIYVQCFMGYRKEGPDEFKPVGETEFAVAAAEQAALKSDRGICAGIVGHADLHLGDRVLPVLEAHLAAGRGRFKGVRHLAMADPEGSTFYPEFSVDPDLYLHREFRDGFAHLARLGLTFDAALFHPQLTQIVDLARAFPETPIVVNHVGYPLGVGRFAGRHAEVLLELRKSFRLLAECPNVMMKFGGFGSKVHNMKFDTAPGRQPSEVLARAFKPYFDLCVDTFGTRRLVFESNFPPDKMVSSYAVLWNAFKRVSAGSSDAERAQMFSENAREIYRL